MPAGMPGRVGFVSLGCPKATWDSEQILSRLRAEGYLISDSHEEADLVIVNTCGFIDEAVAESLEAIGEALEGNGRVIVTGCLGAREGLVEERCPEVLAVTGPHATEEVLELVHRHLPPEHDPWTSLLPPGGVRLTPRHYAWVKIAEGCNHRCTFCIIPSLRGDLVSRPVDSILEEASALVSAGVKELLVVSQDTSAYGVDLRYRTGFWQGRPVRARFSDLAAAMAELGAWVRLHYVYPYPHVDEVLPLMAQGRILPYLDVPLQHASPRILRAMRRPADCEDMLRRIRRWREICPDLTLRSTFIVGFPGETEDEFLQLLEFVSEAGLDRAGAFAYSPVAGAAANALPDPVPEEEKQERLERFMMVQAEVSRERLQRRVGQRVRVLVDSTGPDGAIARSAAEAPEIDGVIQVLDGETLEEGQFAEVEITAAGEHDLEARLVPRRETA
ncbi:MAG: 30S ribosomal protein S12 methylthiotransferase RimO [Gammaproteobacteria bacterium]|nr:MAG: 30S ribosomal protein S12 methylthiotransferase RimO [Gammaproteobacteria bacterium]